MALSLLPETNLLERCKKGHKELRRKLLGKNKVYCKHSQFNCTLILFLMKKFLLLSGNATGEEVVQLYLTHKGEEDEMPSYALKGFKRIY